MYRLKEEQQAIVAEATAIAVAEIGPDAARVDREGTFPKAGIDALGEGRASRPDRAGRARRTRSGTADRAAVLDVIAQHCSSTAMVYLMHLCGVACYPRAPEKTEPRCAPPPPASTSARSRSARRIAQPLLGAR